MRSKRSLLKAANAILAGVIVSALSYQANAQDTRPRYNSPQSAEQTWTLPPDTVINVQLNGALSSRTARVGDKFTATVTTPAYVNGRSVIPAGSIIEGRVTQVTPAKRMNRSGTIGIDFDDLIFPNGARVGLVGTLTSDDPATRRRIDDESRVSGERNNRPAVFIGGGGAIGAVLGGISGGGKGAVLGGVAGAGAGVAGILLSKGEEAQVPSGTPFGVQIKQALIVREAFLSERAPADDQSADRPVESPGRPDAGGSQPDNPDRPLARRTDPETRSEVDRSTAPPADLPLSSPEMVRRAQIALKEQGYFEGEADGVVNPRTSAALKAYQREHNLQETGDLDPQTAMKLGIAGGSAVERPSERREARPDREARADREATPDNAPVEPVMANVLSATASRTQDGAISVVINTQANTGGWRWFGEQVVNGDTLEVYARAVRPTGMVTQALTRGRIDLSVRDGVEYVRRVVVHSAGADQVIALAARGSSARSEPIAPSTATTPPGAISLQRKAEELLSEYQRVYGIRMTGTGVEVDNAAQYRDAEIELLFAIDSFANAAQLYARLATSLRERENVRSATLAMARQARRTDRVISITTSRAADSLASRWDSIRQDVLKLMQSYGISSSEVEN